tara:strand:- start:10 stop:531 length:522 start_codon:yes stop_codon:yes gene_type:complete
MKQAGFNFQDDTLEIVAAKINTENDEYRYFIGIGGEYLVSSKLSFMGFEVLKASRDGTKEDLYIQHGKKTFGVQVKTSQKRADQKNKNKDVWSFDFRLKKTVNGQQISSNETYNTHDIPIFACVCKEKEKVIFIENKSGNQMQYKFDHKDFDYATDKASIEALTKIFKRINND